MIITYLVGKAISDIEQQYDASRKVVEMIEQEQKESVLIELVKNESGYYPVRSLVLSMGDEEDVVVIMGEDWIESDVEQYKWMKYQLGKKGCTLLCIEAVADKPEIEAVEW